MLEWAQPTAHVSSSDSGEDNWSAGAEEWKYSMNTTRRTRHWTNTATLEQPDPTRLLLAEFEPYGRASILHVRGIVDAYTLTRWQWVLESALGTTAMDGGRHLIIDLTKVDFLSLRTIFTLAELARQGCRRGVAISVVEARPYAVTGRVMAVTGLAEMLPVYPDLLGALTAAHSDLLLAGAEAVIGAVGESGDA